MMKKLLALFLAILVVSALAVPALAATSGTDAGNGLGDTLSNITVTGKYVSGAEAEDTYAVDVSWADMSFTYTVEGKNVWNPDTHEYTVEDVVSGWSGEGTITVANHSNVAVSVGFAFQAATGMTGLTGNFTKANFQLAAPAVGSAQSAAPSDTTALTLSGGSLAPEQTTDVEIGSVTVSISAVSTVE